MMMLMQFSQEREREASSDALHFLYAPFKRRRHIIDFDEQSFICQCKRSVRSQHRTM